MVPQIKTEAITWGNIIGVFNIGGMCSGFLHTTHYKVLNDYISGFSQIIPKSCHVSIFLFKITIFENLNEIKLI